MDSPKTEYIYAVRVTFRFGHVPGHSASDAMGRVLRLMPIRMVIWVATKLGAVVTQEVTAI